MEICAYENALEFIDLKNVWTSVKRIESQKEKKIEHFQDIPLFKFNKGIKTVFVPYKRNNSVTKSTAIKSFWLFKNDHFHAADLPRSG